MLFATEGFESFNAVIRSHSIHSNHRAPSRDIAAGMAHHNRLRHFLSGGTFSFPRIVAGEVDEDVDITGAQNSTLGNSRSPWLTKMAQTDHDDIQWRTIGPEPRALLALNGFDVNILGSLGSTEEAAEVQGPNKRGKLSTAGPAAGVIDWL